MTATVSQTDRLRRFLYNSTEKPKYTTGDAEAKGCYDPVKFDVLKEILGSEEDLETMLNVIEAVNTEDLLPRRETIFVTLAYATTTQFKLKNEVRHKVYETLLNVCRSDRDYFTFVKFYSKWRKNFSSGLNKATFAYYSRKDPMVLAKDIARQKRYHGWSHKDVIKLSHGKTSSALTNLVLNYILFDLQKAIDFGQDVADAQGILTFLTHAQNLRRSENMEEIPRLIAEIQATLIQVPSYRHKELRVWEAILPYLDLNFVIQKLPLLHRYGFLKRENTLHDRIIQMLNNVDMVKASGIHPIEVFIGLRNFEKGGKPMDPRLLKHLKSKEATTAVTGATTSGTEAAAVAASKSTETPQEEEKKKKAPQRSPGIVTALNKTFILSLQNNVRKTDLVYFIGIEVSERMERPCLKSKNLSCLEAAVSVALYLYKTEKDVFIGVFNNHAISPVSADKHITHNQLMMKVRDVAHGSVYLPAAFEHAAKRKKPVNVFLNFVKYNHSLELVPKELKKENSINAFNKYRKNKNVPDARLITVSLASPKLSLADGSPHILDICGFDKEIPKVIEAFARGYYL